MRLKKLKLSGFKSFVESTVVNFPGNLVAVVGPNGCGKSNTIDAVRWVMGESSARHLRGESMTDVIFNGSLNRKPMGQASVELVFNNDEGRLVGEYAGYSEISLKRVVTREAQSTYYLNGTKCRKKDITDIFLGTGLGPRSYSIIGQGMISRIIEAKPDELRVFLEEAAGISKYKERRRETENRIRHTRENIERIDDIREELAKQLERLNRQARAARRYKELKQLERHTKAQWHALNWQVLNEQLELEKQKITTVSLQLEEANAALTHCDAQLEGLRQSHAQANDDYHAVQGDFYRVGGEISRLEESLAHHKQRHLQLEQDLNQAKADWASASSHYQQDMESIEGLNEELATLEPQVATAQADFNACQQRVSATEEQDRAWQREWDDFTQASHESSKRAHVEQAKIQYLEQQLQTSQAQIEKLQVEGQDLDVDDLESGLKQLNEHHETAFEQQDKLKGQVEETQREIQGIRLKINQTDEQHQCVRARLQSSQAELATLEAVQRMALGKKEAKVSEWLGQQQLADNSRLAECLSVESGWEAAVEMVLGDTLQAVCVNDCKVFGESLERLGQGVVSFVDKSQHESPRMSCELPALHTLLSASVDSAKQFFSGIYAALDLKQALLWLPRVAGHESIITPCGLWLGHGWLRVKRAPEAHESVLAREQSIKAHQLKCDALQFELDAFLTDLQELKNQRVTLESQHDDLRAALHEANEHSANTKAKWRVKASQLEQMRQRRLHVEDELCEQQEALESHQEQLLQARAVWQQAMSALEGDTDKRARLERARDSQNQTLSREKKELQTVREYRHEKQLQLTTKQSQLSQLKDNVLREQGRINNFDERIEHLTETLSTHLSPNESMREQLNALISQHLLLEKKLADTKNGQEKINEQLLDVEKKRHEGMQVSRELQEGVSQRKLDAESLRVRCQTVLESLEETDFSLPELLDNLPAGASIKAWDEQLNELKNKIDRLGLINLAAIDEYQSESERKRYLDEQCEDLAKALDTLETAIAQIDKETRARFKETFDRVNEGFKELFPTLFGGGQAYLTLTGEDLLDTGVSVMARPPGKRNSSIHLLSGGEKAMAAVALVFAIFRLNPSPFCMLDEVDAPLDDANVGRFCGMVKEMSDAVQFIFITHNKLTMELAEHLSGVTMAEPGVSRIVSVDVEQAMSMSETELEVMD